jgi:hypothetical protein
MTGSAIAMEWENKHIAAIINGRYGEQTAGADIALKKWNEQEGS